MMNRIFLVLIVVTAIVGGYSFSIKNRGKANAKAEKEVSAVNWMTWEQAIAALEADKAAGRKGKKLFVDVYTDWCGWCKKMDKETFQQPAISDYLNKHFYPIKLNAEQKESIAFGGNSFKFVPNGSRGYHELAAALLDNKMSYPTVIFLNEKVELLQRIPGYLDVPTFDCILHYLAEEHYLSTPWADYQSKYLQERQKQEGQKK